MSVYPGIVQGTTGIDHTILRGWLDPHDDKPHGHGAHQIIPPANCHGDNAVAWIRSSGETRA